MDRYRSERMADGVRTAIHIEADDLKLIDRAAKKIGLNRSVFIRIPAIEAAKEIINKELAGEQSP